MAKEFFDGVDADISSAVQTELAPVRLSLEHGANPLVENGTASPVDKGGKIRTYNMLRELKRDHEITYLTLDEGSDESPVHLPTSIVTS